MRKEARKRKRQTFEGQREWRAKILYPFNWRSWIAAGYSRYDESLMIYQMTVQRLDCCDKEEVPRMSSLGANECFRTHSTSGRYSTVISWSFDAGNHIKNQIIWISEIESHYDPCGMLALVKATYWWNFIHLYKGLGEGQVRKVRFQTFECILKIFSRKISIYRALSQSLFEFGDMRLLQEADMLTNRLTLSWIGEVKSVLTDNAGACVWIFLQNLMH